MAIDLTRMSEGGVSASRSPSARVKSSPSWSFGSRVSGKDMIYFTSQLSLMLEVGTSLTDAMHALELQTSNPTLLSVIQSLSRDMEEGQTFSAALSRHKQVFDGVFISMVRAGETGGYLRDALDRIVEMKERRELLLAEIRGALTYPIILTVVSVGVIIFVITGVLPKFMPLFEGKEHLLPGTTRFLMAASLSMREYWWAYLIGVSVVGVLGRLFGKSDSGQWLRDRAEVSLPVIAPLCNRILTGQLLRTLGHLLEGHVVLTDALEVTRDTMRNRFYRQFIQRVDDIVRGGGRLAQGFAGFQEMPATVRQMIATAEDAGHLYPVMLRLAKHYDREVDQQLKRVASLIEPAALVILGALVGLIVASVILPLFKMAHAIG